MVHGSGFRVQSLGFRVQGLEYALASVEVGGVEWRVPSGGLGGGGRQISARGFVPKAPRILRFNADLIRA